MAAPPPDLDVQTIRLTQRLARLFRAERVGRFDVRPFPTVRRLIERRAALIDRLIAAAMQHQTGATPHAPVLAEALAALAREAGLAREPAERRLAALGAELRIRHGGMPATGLRGDAGGRLLGQG